MPFHKKHGIYKVLNFLLAKRLFNKKKIQPIFRIGQSITVFVKIWKTFLYVL